MQFDRTLAWATGELGAWSIITARSALAAGDGGFGKTIFTNSTLKDQWVAMWRALATRYASTDTVAGYEVMSEPRTNSNSSHVHELQQEACDAIWAADPRAVCFVGPAKFYNRYHLSADYLLNGGPAIYAANFFEPKAWIVSNQSGTCKTGDQCAVPYGSDQFLCREVNTKLSGAALVKKCGGSNSTKKVTVDRDWIATELAVVANFSTRYNVPVWIDQWGLQASAVGGDATQIQYMKDILAEFDVHKFHWTYWIWRRTKAWGEGGYAIERQTDDGSYSVFELALRQIGKYIGSTID